MGKDRIRQISVISRQKRICHPSFRRSSFISPLRSCRESDKQFTVNVRSHLGTPDKASRYQTGRPQPSRLLQLGLLGREENRRLSPYSQPKTAEQVYQDRPYVLDHSTISQESSSARWLDVPHRPEGRLLPREHRPGVTTSAPILVAGNVLPVHTTTIRSGLRPFHLYTDSAANHRFPSRARYPDFCLPRRLAHRRELSVSGKETFSSSLQDSSRSRICTQREIHPNPHSIHSVVGNRGRSQIKSFFPSVIQEGKNPDSAQLHPPRERVDSEDGTRSIGEVELHFPVHTIGKIISTTPTEVVHRKTRTLSSTSITSIHLPRGEETLASVDARPILERSNANLHEPNQRSHSSNRRVSGRLGSASRLPRCSRSLERRSEVLEHKLSRAPGHLAGSKPFPDDSSSLSGQNKIRQHDRSSSVEELGYDSFSPSSGNNVEDPPPRLELRHFYIGRASSRKNQHQSGPPLQDEDGGGGVDTPPPRLQPYYCDLGSPSDRPICVRGELPSRAFQDHRTERSPGSVLSRSSHVCVPTIQTVNPPNREGPGVHVLQPDCRGTPLAESSMVPAPPVLVRATSIASGSPRGSPSVPGSGEHHRLGERRPLPTSRVEAVKVLRPKSLSADAITSFFGADAASTRQLYDKNFFHFANWFNESYNDYSQFNIDSVILFVVTLINTGRAFTTINNYVYSINSVYILCFGNAMSQHPVLKKIMSGTRKKNQCRPKFFPEWDINVVLTYLNSDVFEPLSEARVSRVLQKTVFLVLLASSRRPSDIAGLGYVRNENWFIRGPDKVYLRFHPLFRPKNKSSKFFPEPISFAQLFDADNARSLSCPVRALDIYLRKTRDQRDKSITYLFLPVKTSSYKLTTTYVSNIVKSVVVEAYRAIGQGFPRHSVQGKQLRTLASSIAFHAGKPLQDVLRAGGWSHPSTFIRHYLAIPNATVTQDAVICDSVFNV